MEREPVHPIDYRYGDEKILSLFSEKNKYKTMIEVEAAVAEAQAEIGIIPREAAREISEVAKMEVNVKRIKELEKETKHEIAALVRYIEENCERYGRFVHFGLTSNDVIDTAFAVILQNAGKMILENIEEICKILAKKSIENKEIVCVARTHGIHAEPYIFGLKFAEWLLEFSRSYERIKRALEDLKYGKLSGAVGTYLSIGEEEIKAEEIALKKLGLKPSPISTQIVPRDTYARFISEISILSSILDKAATEIRNLQRTEIDEARESFTPGQVGSSAMPHKRNPINCEKISGIARVIRGLSISMLENLVLWHERDLSNSSTERIVFPEVFGLISEQLITFRKVLEEMEIRRESIQRNLLLTNGRIFSELLLTELIKRGMSRKEAHSLISYLSSKSENEKRNLLEVALEDERIKSLMQREEVENVFSEKRLISIAGKIISRTLEESEKLIGRKLLE